MSEAAGRLAASLAGRHRIERELGAGGMATVYLAQDLKHGRKVAVKVLREEFSTSLGKERFLREIKGAGGWAARWPMTRSARSAPTRTIFGCASIPSRRRSRSSTACGPS
jgi:serine/threonine protein kinase